MPNAATVFFDDLLGAPYVHLGREPSTGLDCLGVVLEVQRRLGFDVKDPVPTYAKDPGKAFAENWAASWSQVETPEVGDAVLMQTAGKRWPNHVGVIVEPGRVLHATEKTGAAVEPLARLIEARRVTGFFRPRRTNKKQDAHQEECAPKRDGHLTANRAQPPCYVACYVSVVVVDGQESRPFVAQPGEEVWAYLPAGVERAGLVAFANGVRVDSGPVEPGVLTFFRPIADPTGGVAVTFLGLEVFGVGSALLGTALAVVGNAIIGGLLAYLGSMIARPDSAKLDGADEGRPTFDLTGVRNTAQNGATIPVVYGEHKVGGQIIQLFQRTGADMKSRLYMLLCLSEGAVESIGGFTSDVDNAPSALVVGSNIELNGNPIENYPESRVSVRLGTIDQSPIPGFEETVLSGSVNQVVDNATDVRNYVGVVPENADTVTYTTSQAIDAFEINLRFPGGRYKVNTDGDTESLGFVATLRYRRVGNAASEVAEFVLIPPLALRADHTITIRRQNLTRDLYEISLTKQYPDNANENRIFADFTWTTTNEITNDGAISYAGRALLAIEAVATNQLSGGIPTVTSIVKGKKVWVWDEASLTSPNFNFEWSDNPAWIALDLLLNETYGLGSYVSLNDIDIQSFADWANYNDASLTTDGVTHSRWQFDHVFDVQRPAWDSIQEIAASSRASVIYNGAKFKARFDHTASPSQLFNMGNIVRGSFEMSYLDSAARPNFVEVQYVNRELGYDQDVAQLENITDSIRKQTLRLIGITRPEQAYRACKYMLNVSDELTKTLRFSAPIDAVAVEPGDVFYFSHDALALTNESYSGRITAAGSSTIAIDRAINVQLGWKLYYRTTGGGASEQFFEVTPTAGTYSANQLISCGVLTVVPEIGDIYVIGHPTTYRTTWRCVRRSLNEDLTTNIEAVEYVADVYDDDPGVIETFTDQWPDPRVLPSNPTNVIARNASATAKDGTVWHTIDVSFVPESQGDLHDVWFRYEGAEGTVLPAAPDRGGWSHGATTRTERATINVAASYARTVKVSVTPRSERGSVVEPDLGAKAVCFILGKVDEPGSPNIINAQIVEDKINAKWASSASYDVDCVEFRQSSASNRWLFAQSVKCEKCSPMVAFPHYYGSTYLLAKAINRSRIPSLTPDYLAMVPSVLTGTFQVNGSVTTSGWTGAGTSDTNFTLTGSTFASDASATSATWQSANTTFSLNALHCRVHALLDARGLDLVSTWADLGMPWDDPFLSRRDWAGNLFDVPHPEQEYTWDQSGQMWDSPISKMQSFGKAYDWSTNLRVLLEYSLATDSGATTWGDWVEYAGPFECKDKYYVRWRVTFTSTAGEYGVELSTLYVQALDLTPASGSGGLDDDDVYVRAVMFG